MKRLSLLLCVTLLAVAAPAPSARAEVAVSVDFFYDALSPHGDWVYTDNYGYIWQPAVAQHADWAPYADGYWAYTDAGWTWISNEDFGWATYHYGRWVRMYDRWFWVPGNEWAPAWVSWRQTDDHIGWAPLPPEAYWSNDVGFNWWTDSYYDIGPSYYSFVPIISFATQRSLRPFIMDRRQNWGYVDRSRNITNISYRQNVFNNIFVGGPDPDRIDRFGDGRNRIRRLSLHRDDDNFRRDWVDNRGERPRGFGSLSRIDRDRLIVAAPSIRRDNSPGLPPRVRERFDRPEIDRGWRGGDAGASERLRSRQREDLVKARQEKMPEKKPAFITSKAPPPAVGRPLKPEERRDLTQRPDPRRVDEEVRKATPTKPSTPPRVANDPPGSSGRKPGTPGTPDRDGVPGRRTDNDGPGRAPQVRPGESPTGRPMPGAPGARPGETVRPDGPPGIRPGSPSNRPDGPPGSRPGDSPSNRPDSPPGIRPGSPSNRPDSPPGLRPGGSPSNRPDGPPGNRPDRAPESRRPSVPNVTPDQPRTPSIPMPEARPENRARPAPMPRPEVPRVRPSPMPQPSSPPPQFRPSQPERRPEPPRQAPPSRPQPEARPVPTPQPGGSSPQGRAPGGPPQSRGDRGGPGEKRNRD